MHRLQNIYMKSESSPGTPIAIAGTDTLEADTLTFRYAGQPVTRTPVKSNLGGEAPAPIGPRWVELDLSMECKVSSGAAAAPEWGRILRAAGMKETLAANALYEPWADPNAAANYYSLTVQGESDLDGNTYAAYGVRFGTLEFSHKQGERMMLSAKGVGGYTAVTDQAALTSPTSYGTLPFSVEADASGFLFQAWSAPVSEWSLSIPIDVARRPHGGGTAAQGYHRWPPYVTWNGNPILKFTAESVDQTAFTAFARWTGSTAASGTITMSNGTRTCTFAIGSSVIQSVELVDAPTGPQLYRVTAIVCRTGSTAALTITTA